MMVRIVHRNAESLAGEQLHSGGQRLVEQCVEGLCRRSIATQELVHENEVLIARRSLIKAMRELVSGLPRGVFGLVGGRHLDEEVVRPDCGGGLFRVAEGTCDGVDKEVARANWRLHE